MSKMTEEEIEKDLTLIGVSGLADKLQEDVKKCVSEFIEAGIKIWILTGDKDSTAKSVGYDCGILNPSRDMLSFSQNNETTNIDKNAFVK